MNTISQTPNNFLGALFSVKIISKAPLPELESTFSVSPLLAASICIFLTIAIILIYRFKSFSKFHLTLNQEIQDKIFDEILDRNV